MWGDEKFCNLSPIPPCGQGLWVYLLTGPHTGPIPGIFRIGRAAMAEELNWDLEAFDEAFREAFQQGMVKADWKAKVVWIPNAVACNRPESPNVVTSWGAEWELIPECDLKREAFERIKATIHGLGEAFAKAFDKAFSKPSGKTSAKGIDKTSLNQEQEQEQEQEEEQEATASVDDGENPPSVDLLGEAPTHSMICPAQRIVDAYHELMPDNPRVKNLSDGRRKNIAARWKEAAKLACKPFGYSTVEDGMRAWRKFFTICSQSAFLTGKVEPQQGRVRFMADIDWLMNAANFTKVLENKYHREAA
nr:hypothetical protein HUO10_003296 [Paraburkholderia busanensis]